MTTPVNLEGLSPIARQIYEEATTCRESSITEANGDTWYSVYLDNVRPKNCTARQFAGYLSALQAAGLYRFYDEAGHFGEFRLEPRT